MVTVNQNSAASGRVFSNTDAVTAAAFLAACEAEREFAQRDGGLRRPVDRSDRHRPGSGGRQVSEINAVTPTGTTTLIHLHKLGYVPPTGTSKTPKRRSSVDQRNVCPVRAYGCCGGAAG